MNVLERNARRTNALMLMEDPGPANFPSGNLTPMIPDTVAPLRETPWPAETNPYGMVQVGCSPADTDSHTHYAWYLPSTGSGYTSTDHLHNHAIENEYIAPGEDGHTHTIETPAEIPGDSDHFKYPLSVSNNSQRKDSI